VAVKLTAKQEEFCRQYLVDLNATQAAIRSGYSEKTAQEQSSRLLSNVIVAGRIKELMDKRSAKTEITAEYVLSTIKEVMERCKQAEPVRDKDGNETGEWQFKEHGALKAAELLGKHLKLFTDKVEHSGKITLEDIIAGDE
jgi:phage terminase small subunit